MYFPGSGQGSLCTAFKKNNLTVHFLGPRGNAPRLVLIGTGVVGGHGLGRGAPPAFYDTVNGTVLSLEVVVDDGRDDNLKICNGLGRCDWDKGTCDCVVGYGRGQGGPCYEERWNTSRDTGRGRCPGTVAAGYLDPQTAKVLDQVENFSPRILLSVNPLSGGGPLTPALSGVYSFDYEPRNFYGPRFGGGMTGGGGDLVVTLTSTVSAGALAVDNMFNLLFFIDANPASPFIGKQRFRNCCANICVYVVSMYIHST